MVERGEKPYRGRQIAKGIYQRLARTPEEMTDLPKALRAGMSLGHRIVAVEAVDVVSARDETRKILFQLHDGAAVEGVLMRSDHRWSMCVSTQVGCALHCQFCLTGTLGLKRNLTAAEIVDQVLLGKRILRDIDSEALLTNVVLMGMGEPLLNLDNVLDALRVLTAPNCVAMSTRRITVSTAGVTPGIARLGAEGGGVNLAVSLNATTDEQRRFLMPHAEQWPLAGLLQAMRDYPLASHRRLTVEHVMLDSINDTVTDARRLAKLVRGMRCKINLIPFNEVRPLPFKRSPSSVIDKFQRILLAEHHTVSVRHSKGRSIDAACGQLVGSLAESAP